MAQQRGPVEHVLNQENQGKIATKVLVPAKGGVPKRPALGEVKLNDVNKLSNANNALTNGALKKGGVMGAPQVKKTVSNGTKVVERRQVTKENTFANTHIEDNKISTVRRSSYSKQINIINPDENSKNDPQMVTEYLGDIFSYLRELECRFPIKKNFLEGHQSTPRMRTILVNWLVEVHMNFKLYLETLHLCIAIVDRYLQENKGVGRNILQLVGTTALLIASKYEEMYLPDLDEFVYICDDTFSKRQILRMEMDILKKLDFNLGRPLSVHFLRRYNKVAQVRSDHHALGKYLLELSLLEHNMSHIKPSIQAAAVCCLSIAILNEVMNLPKIWTPTLVHYTTYEYADFKNVIVDFAHLIVKSQTSKYQMIRQKYATSTYAKISLNSKLNGPLIRKLTLTSITKK
ncbi:hypothetical protein NQ315_009308 [Exocentrus adspersus]|uniref:Cyclin B n=1 Tax=Exocentrus adspersus TaxID=1586481 RepID=A0AAV8WG01_9CUCU|nr:hypothetical protein NQ315_009308 [Exocentrus adspersus]